MTFPSHFDVGMNLFNYLGCKKQVWATNANGGYGRMDGRMSNGRTDVSWMHMLDTWMDGWTGEGRT